MMDAEPKSPSFTKPGSDNRMFPAFTSLPKKQSTGIRHASQEGWVWAIAPSSKRAAARLNAEWCGEHAPPSQPSPVLPVPMDHVVGVQISQALKGPVGHSCNLHLLKGLLMH